MMANVFKWSTTNTTDHRMLYLTVMRDLKNYCSRGYCDITICLNRFLLLPNSFIARSLRTLPYHYRKDHFIVDWTDLGSVRAFFGSVFIIISHIVHVEIRSREYQAAFEEFTQNLTKK